MPALEGRGAVTDFDLTALYDSSKSLSEGALTIPGYSMDGWYGRIYRGCGFFDPDKPISKFTKKELDALLYKEPTKIKVEGINLTYSGLIPQIQKSFLAKDREAMQPHIRAFVDRAVVFTTCPDCEGTRLSEAARSSKVKGVSIADACKMQISDLAEWVRGLNKPSMAPLLANLSRTLDSFTSIGLGYLSLDRPSGTLSGGEAQRTKMIRHLGSSLTDVTYVFDEPTIGLHPHDIARMNTLLLQLRDKGNTVLVVEHKPEAIAIADHIVDLDPLDWIDRYGWRRLHPKERLAAFHFYKEVGERMAITDIPDTLAQFQRFKLEYEAREFRYSPDNHDIGTYTLELFSGWFPRPLRPMVRRGAYAFLGEQMTTAFGFPSGSARLREFLASGLRLRARAVRWLPPRRVARLTGDPRNRTYPGYPMGYRPRDLGTPRTSPLAARKSVLAEG